MPTQTIRWGVISTANIGRSAVIPAIHAAHNSEMLAVASRSQSSADGFAQANRIPRAYGSYEALLADEEIDAVYIPLPNTMHHEWTIKAAEAGKHILCEKPLAMSVAECEEMAAAADANGVVLMEAFMYRFHPQTERVMQMVQAGALGQIGQINASFSFRLTNRENIRLSAELGGGSLMDVGCYCVNIIRTVAAAAGAGEPVSVQAHAVWGDTGVDEQMVGTLHFANGLTATFDSALTLARRHRYTVAGTEGFMHVPTAFVPGTEDVQIVHRSGHNDEQILTIPGVDEYEQMVVHFADALINGTPVRYSPAEAAENMRVIRALYRSADEGDVVEVG